MIKNKNGSIKIRKNGKTQIVLGKTISFSCTSGIVVLHDGKMFNTIDIINPEIKTDSSKDNLGSFDSMSVSGGVGEGIISIVTWTLYREHPVCAIEMEVTNNSGNDAIIDRLILLKGMPPEEGFDRKFPKAKSCRYLAHPFYWHGHFDVQNYIPLLGENSSGTAYWSTVIGESGKPSLAIGIGETATGGAEITFTSKSGKVGLELSSFLRTDLKGRLFRLPVGKSFKTQRMIFVTGDTPLEAIDHYSDIVCRYINLKPAHPPYTGLFTAYGCDPEGKDPGRVSLSEKRIDELMDVVVKYLAPYGLDTIKTQFHGLSSSKPGDGQVQKLTAEEAEDAAKVKKLVADIKEKAFAPDDYDSRIDYPHGIPWHVKKLAEQGYRPALVSRPFYNIKAGTPALDKAAADLYEMTVKDWGYRYLMLDFITADYDSDYDTMTLEQGIYNRLKAIRDRLGKDIFIEACMTWHGPVLGVADGFRPAHDWRGGLEEDLAGMFACRYHLHGRFFQNDIEFFDPAKRPFTWGKGGVEGMQSTEERVRLWTSYCAMLGYSYLTGGCLEKVEPERWHIFQRGIPAQEGLAIPLDFFENDPPTRWLRKCSTPSGEYYVLGIYNWNKSKVYDSRLSAEEWGLDKKAEYLLFDFWTGEVIGPSKSVKVQLSPFSQKLFHINRVPDKPAIVGTTRHVLGNVGIVKWKIGKNEIQATFTGAPDSQERYWVWLPDNQGIAECVGANFDIVRPRLLRLDVTFSSSGKQDVMVKLDKGIPVP